MKKILAHSAFLPAFLGLGVLLQSGCASRQAATTGEVSLHKAVPLSPLLEKDRSQQMFILRNPGFSAAENTGTLCGPFGSTEFAGLKGLKDFALQVRQAAKDKRLQMALKNELQNLAIVTNLDTVIAGTEEIIGRLDARIQTNGSTSNETALLDTARAFAESEIYFDNIQLLINDLKQTEPAKRQNPEILFTIPGGGMLIPQRDWAKISQPGGKIVDEPTSIATLNPSRKAKRFGESKAVFVFGDTISNSINGYKTQLQTLPSHTKAESLLNELEPLLKLLVEDLFNYASSIDRKTPFVWMRTLDREAAMAHKPDAGRVPVTPVFQDQEYEYAFSRISLNAGKCHHLTDQLLSILKRELDNMTQTPSTGASLNAPNFNEDKSRLEEYAALILRLTERDLFHKITAQPKDGGTTFLTITLKTLYLHYLEDSIFSLTNRPPEARSADLLVNVMVQNQNKEPNTYPVIFERRYAPGHFVNRVDRYLYGPTPYDGNALDLRFQVQSLHDLNNTNILNGFAAISGIIGTANPEFAAISPALNSFFAGIVNAATRASIELDFSFTIPQPEGNGKADTDFLINETGHYILLKKENVSRKEYKLNRSATSRDVYRRLIYNPADGRLYYRKHYSDPQQNFTEKNLFLDQSYAVIVVTDEYAKEDKLGEALRVQLGRTLGEERARKYIPDNKEVREMLEFYRTASTVGRAGTNLISGDQTLQQLKQELWNPISDMRRQVITEALYQRADPETQLLLGSDPEKWKRANVELTADGKIKLKSASFSKLLLKLKGTNSPPKLSLFNNDPSLGSENATLLVFSDDGRTTSEFGDVKGNSFPATVPAKIKTTNLVIQAMSKTTLQPVASQIIGIAGEDFGLSYEANGTAQEVTPGSTLNVEKGKTVTLRLTERSTDDFKPRLHFRTAGTNSAPVFQLSAAVATNAVAGATSVQIKDPGTNQPAKIDIAVNEDLFDPKTADLSAGQIPVKRFTIEFAR